jgi:hypothetical protein
MTVGKALLTTYILILSLFMAMFGMHVSYAKRYVVSMSSTILLPR